MTSTMRPGEETQSLADQAKEHAQDTAREVKGQTREQLRSQLDDRSTQVGEQAASTARAMHRASSQLREEGNERAAGLIDAVADRGQRLGEYLRGADGEQLLRDVEAFARRQPWLMVGGSAVAGFLGSRFVKASSHGRYQAQHGGAGANNGYPHAVPTASPPISAPGDAAAGFSGGSGRRAE
jgi:hypothetical protein